MSCSSTINTTVWAPSSNNALEHVRERSHRGQIDLIIVL